MDGDTIDVLQEYTDGIACMQPTVDTAGNKGNLVYREMRVLLARKRENDTIVISKDDFKPFMGRDFPDHIMQSAGTNIMMNGRAVPLLISLCIPDTDVCSEFSVALKDGKPAFMEIIPNGD